LNPQDLYERLMTTALIHCPKCQVALLPHAFNQGDFAPCATCHTPLQMEIFPALFRRPEAGQAGETILTEGEAGCFYHPQKKAVLPCEGCGRFLCALCDCDHRGQHLCPSCLETGRTKGKIKSLENKRTRYDNLALALALFPFLIFYFTIITAPMTLYVTLRYWKAPLGLTQRSRIKLGIAAGIATLQIAGWAAGLIAIFTR
jgi:uncharacterized paraquat-inducible protein A